MEGLERRGLICIVSPPLPRACQASLDQPTQTVVMHRTEPTAQQNLALQLAEKLGSLVENNERVFDHKQGTYGGYFRGECFRLLSSPGFWYPHSLSPGTPSPSFPSLSCRPEGRLPQKRGLHAPWWLPPAAISNGLLSSPLSLTPRLSNLEVLSHTSGIKSLFKVVMVDCLLPQRCVESIHLLIIFLSYPHDRHKAQMQR